MKKKLQYRNYKVLHIAFQIFIICVLILAFPFGILGLVLHYGFDALIVLFTNMQIKLVNKIEQLEEQL
jgi:hypothetical protein